jgi:kynurenine formamidase
MFIDLTLLVDVNDPMIAQASADPNNYMSRGHIGTHLDVYPGQAFPPIDYVKRRALLVDVSGLNGRDIDIDALAGLEIKDGDFLVFYAGHLEKFVYGAKEYYKTQPKFTWELVLHLAESKVAFIGLDFPGMRPGDEHGDADQMIGNGGGYVIENMANVDKLNGAVKGREFEILTGWTGYAGMSGLQCRVVADLATA